MQDYWRSIRERTLRVRSAFGVEAGTPLSEGEVAEAERQFGVVLPEHYRRFLRTVDSGGLGPVDLRRLVVGDGGWGWEGDSDTDLTALGEPFPDQETFGEEYDAFYAGSRFLSTDDERDEWREREVELLRRQTRGAVHLGEEGHNFSTLLVISGPERGNVWFDSRATSDRIVPFRRADGRGASFAEWYVDWLEAAERLLDSGATQPNRREVRSGIHASRFTVF